MGIVSLDGLGNKKTTIVRVVNRTFLREALVNGLNGKNLKGTRRLRENSKIFINKRFC